MHVHRSIPSAPARAALAAMLLALLLPASALAQPPDAALHRFHVRGMTCGLCSKAIEKSLRAVEGVREVRVDRDAEQVEVVAAPEVDASGLEAAIEAAGAYEAEPIATPAHAREG